MSTLLHRTLTSALVVAAASVPAAAQAREPVDLPAPPPASAPGELVAIPGPEPASASSSGDGFQWGDAGLGAAGATVLLGAGAAVSLGVRRRRTHPAV
jgi:hypothetical protein